MKNLIRERSFPRKLEGHPGSVPIWRIDTESIELQSDTERISSHLGILRRATHPFRNKRVGSFKRIKYGRAIGQSGFNRSVLQSDYFWQN